MGGNVGAAEFKRIADEVLQQLPHLQGIGLNRRQLSQLHPTPALRNLHLQVRDHIAGDFRQIDRYEVLGAGGDAGKRQQAVDQQLHPRRGVLHPLDAIAAYLVKPIAALHLQAVAEARVFRSGSWRSWEAT